MLEHRIAQLAAVCTFLLLIIGGTVNPTGSSLACPEPTMVCHGELFPEMTGGVLYEHGHRLAAMSVGLLQIALTVLLLRRRRRGMAPMRGLAWTTLAMVCLQGALGAITVKYKLPWFVSTAHLMLGMSYFATLIHVARRTMPAPELGARSVSPRPPTHFPARRWVHLGAAVVAIQILLGGLVRHSEAALACLDIPGCTVAEFFPADWTQRLHMIHRGWGVVVGVVTMLAAAQIARRAAGWPALRRMMIAASVLVVAQIGLGVYVVLTFRAIPVAVGHFAGAALLWGLWATAWLMTSPRERVSVRQAPASSRPDGEPAGRWAVS